VDDLTEEDKLQQNQSDRHTRRKFDAGGKFIADWFQGTSESVTLGVLRAPAKDYPAIMNSPPETSMANTQGEGTFPPATSGLQKRMTAPSALRQVASSTRFPWFASRSQEPARPTLPEPADDEFLNLDITGALFPSGSRKEYSQEAFEALQANAEDILRRLQAAYKQRTFALHEVLAEKTEQQEELADARTRVQNVKTQLDDMAEKVFEQQKTIKALDEQLQKERQARREAEDARRRVEVSGESFSGILETPRRHNKRSSSSTLTSDSGFESGDDSAAESVFSRRIEYPGSPLSSMSTPSCSTSPEVTSSPAIVTTSHNTPSKTPSPMPQTQPRLSTYDRVVKGLSPLTSTLVGATNTPAKCSNCHGVLASEAWSVVGILKEENKGLKTRIGDLESVIDDCLNLVGS